MECIGGYTDATSKLRRTLTLICASYTLCNAYSCYRCVRLFAVVSFYFVALVLFDVYDIMHDGKISNGELFYSLRLIVGDSLTDEQLQQARHVFV